MDTKCAKKHDHAKTVAYLEAGRRDKVKHVSHAALGNLFQIVFSVVQYCIVQ